VTSDHIIATVTLNTIVAFVIPFEKELCKSTVPMTRGYQRSKMLTSPLVMWREERILNFSAL
jgi:hypothetical protein